ncbi:MGMT family protein [Litoribacter ruber]|uniref:MGMT family protein n=1 Tax=Litoribacter ruber TaxID=702568 RepID=UPI001BDACFCB|nr:MGMT family protein [Litoribacter ruber]MBT0811087.1 MGMT family protein [Litoribacter ruber]
MKSNKENLYANIYELVRLIPEGRVTTYGSIAKALGLGSGARVVGYAMNASHTENVPAHRVVNRNGQLTGKHHFPTPTAMETLLKAEGVNVENDQIVDFEKHFWDPASLEGEI